MDFFFLKQQGANWCGKNVSELVCWERMGINLFLKINNQSQKSKL